MKNLIIAISGKSGCGNTTVSRLTAEALNYRLINYTFHNLALEMGLPFEELCRRAEDDPQYDYLVDEKQLAFTRGGGCLLASRLAIWLCKEADLKVFLTAPPEVRAARIHRREGGRPEEVLAQTLKRDQHDHDRYQKLYGIDNNDYAFADLIIDTQDKDPPRIVGLILGAIQEKQNSVE
ncbi:MAG: AAA family ATPase [Spirochaetales bacterium]|jgi:cytidylate kinase|nr:AAA family ATPase [Spirochaetales bacterium]